MPTSTDASGKHSFFYSPKLSLWRIFRQLLPYLGSSLFIWLLLRQIGFRAVWRLLSSVDMSWLFVGFGWYLLTNILRSYRFGTLLTFGYWKPLRLLPDMILLSFLNNVLPARSGELTFPYLLQRRHNIPLGDGLTYLLIVRIFDLLAVATLFIVFALLERHQLANSVSQALSSVSFLLLPVLLMLAALPWLGSYCLLLGEKLLRLLRLDERQNGQKLLALGQRIVVAMRQVHHADTYSRVFLWSILGWLTTFAWFAAFLRAIHLPTPYPLVIVGATFATISKAIPLVTVGGFGVHEAGWSLGFLLVGMSLETAVASGFAVNMLTLVTSITLTGFTSIWLGKTRQC